YDDDHQEAKRYPYIFFNSLKNPYAKVTQIISCEKIMTRTDRSLQVVSGIGVTYGA
ncbi:33228_t:CDS:1, partial [Gigaspora margarita]